MPEDETSGTDRAKSKSPYFVERGKLPDQTVEARIIDKGPDGKDREIGTLKIVVPGRKVRIEHHFDEE